MMDSYRAGIGASAGSLMLKWDQFASHVYRHDKIRSGDTINVFINFESILRNLTMWSSLQELATFHRQDVIMELESSILNVVANYKAFFKKSGVRAMIYLYYTDMNTEEQGMRVFNKYYRSYYTNKYSQNPKHKVISQIMDEAILKDIELILSYVQDCYFVRSKRFDSFLIPHIVEQMNGFHSVIVSSDVYDTLYLFHDNFSVVYIKRRMHELSIISDIDGAIQSIIKTEDPFSLTIFRSELYYKLLLAIKGSRVRNIKASKGFGYGKFMRILQTGMDQGVVLKDFGSIGSVIEMFPEKYREDIQNAFRCTDLNTQIGLLTEGDIESVKVQLVDKVDSASLESLNRQRFASYPINLEMLI